MEKMAVLNLNVGMLNAIASALHLLWQFDKHCDITVVCLNG